ncbi:MAG: altronate dehydratase family protein, partial [Bacteroidota bacterium]
MITLIHIHPDDNVAVAVERLEAGATVSVGELAIRLREPILAGHKVALRDLDAGAPIIKYGFPIGSLSEGVVAGGWVHSHNLKTGLGELLSYHYRPALRTPETRPMPYFDGYRRSSGRVGTRNEIWVLNTVGCVNRAAERIAQHAARRFGDRVDGFHAFSHPYGCSQLGDDLQYTQRVLAGLMRHPNAGGVLVLGLGCENNQMADLMAMAGDVDPRRVRFFNSQEVLDEVEEGLEAVGELVEVIAHDQRVPCPASDLVLGLKCGGSDGFSGLTANPLVGHVADRLTDLGGTALLTEVPEMFGAEQVLMNRAQDEATFAAIGRMINDFKQYFIRHDQPIYENPSPGN